MLSAWFEKNDSQEFDFGGKNIHEYSFHFLLELVLFLSVFPVG